MFHISSRFIVRVTGKKIKQIVSIINIMIIKIMNFSAFIYPFTPTYILGILIAASKYIDRPSLTRILDGTSSSTHVTTGRASELVTFCVPDGQ